MNSGYAWILKWNPLYCMIQSFRNAMFGEAMEHYAQKNAARLEMLTAYIKRNPGVKSADVIKFVSDQPDFADDAAYMRVC